MFMPFLDAMMGFGGFAMIVLLVLGVLWLWMLIDLLQRKRFEDKLVWLMVLIFLNVLGAILYYFLVYSRKR